jgi:hypothetical protein
MRTADPFDGADDAAALCPRDAVGNRVQHTCGNAGGECGWGRCLTLHCASAAAEPPAEPCQEIRSVGLIMKDRLLVDAASGEVLEGARIFHTKLRAINAEPRGREVQGQAMPPSPLRQSQRNLLAGFA